MPKPTKLIVEQGNDKLELELHRESDYEDFIKAFNTMLYFMWFKKEIDVEE